MFCRKCGTEINDDALFCYACGERIGLPPQPAIPQPNQSMSAVGSAPVGSASAGSTAKSNVKEYLLRGIVGVAAAILVVVALVFFVKLVTSIERVINIFSVYDGGLTAAGIVGFIVCGLLLAICAALAALPLARFALEDQSAGRSGIDRSMVLTITLLVLCVAVWICKLVFNSASSTDISGVLFNIFSTYGAAAASCFVAIIIALVILYIARTKLLPAVSARY